MEHGKVNISKSSPVFTLKGEPEYSGTVKETQIFRKVVHSKYASTDGVFRQDLTLIF